MSVDIFENFKGMVYDWNLSDRVHLVVCDTTCNLQLMIQRQKHCLALSTHCN